MNKKIIAAGSIIIVILIGLCVYLFISMNSKDDEVEQKDKQLMGMQQLAEMDKKEMEGEYEKFSNQYQEMKTMINNDSIVAQLTREQQRTQKLLEELRKTKSNDAAEIARLKKELATCREIIRGYVLQIDSLNRLNQNLRAENTQIRGQYDEATRQIEGLNSEKESLNQKVAIAAQLDATAIQMSALTDKGKSARNLKKTTKFQVNFNIAKNVTAAAGNKTVYVRINTPSGSTLNESGSFNYENRNIAFSARRSIEYSGQETPVTVYCNASETLVAGTYKVSIFCDGNMIGSKSFSFEK